MKSEMATKHMAELTTQMEDMGIEVIGVYVPEKRMKNDDIRQEVAKQAVIGIKAEAERAAADAKAYATVKAARAEAEAIELLAAAHADAGTRLGAPETTASRLALSETMTKAIQGSNLTVFSGAPDSMPFMFGAPPAGYGATSPATRR
jgi:regulator of protease activity HflC (stomatin/prohibitin superfamily)